MALTLNTCSRCDGAMYQYDTSIEPSCLQCGNQNYDYESPSIASWLAKIKASESPKKGRPTKKKNEARR